MFEIGREELSAIENIFNTQKMFRYHQNELGECDIFEKEFASYLGVKHSLMVTSGTNALRLACEALSLGPDDEVIISCYTFIATAVAVINVGATPVVVDINDSLSIDLEVAKSKITSRTRALIITHMDGLNCDMNAVVDFCKKYDLHLIEDCAQALGGSYQGKHLGTWGKIGCFSFNRDKILSCGEGGAVITNDKVLYQKMFCLHDPATIFLPATKDRFTLCDPMLGSSMRVSEISGAIMRVQLKRLDSILSSMRKTKHVFREHLARWLVDADDIEGECATSIHLKVSNQQAIPFVVKALIQNGFAAIPPTMRPAHTAWKWTHLFNENAAPHPKRNPFANKPFSYKKSESINTVSLLTSLIKLDTPYPLSSELEATSKAVLVKEILTSHG